MPKQNLANRRSIVAASSAAVLALLLAFPHTGSTHEPITTKVMFNKEVIRILERNCLGCHTPGKIKGDIPLTTYDEARPWAKAIKEEILEKRMMPYQAVKGYGRFQHDYVLEQRDVELLVSWIEGGAPRGDVKDYPKEKIDKLIDGREWGLGKPDLIVQPAEEAKIAAEEDEQTRCFTIPTGLREDRWIHAIDFQPGNGAIVYSAWFGVERGSQPGTSRSGGRGKDNCPANAESLGQWVPGQSVNHLPPGYAIKLPAASRIVMKIRYSGNGEPATDRSRLGLYFAKESTNKAVRNVAIDVPAAATQSGEAPRRIKASYTVAEPAELLAIRPLLFPFARSIEASVHHPDGAIEVLIWAQNYRHDWQPAYFLRKPAQLPRNARIEVTAYLDDAGNNRENPGDPAGRPQSANTLCEIALTASPPSRTASLK
jgi:hypothetical protein